MLDNIDQLYTYPYSSDIATIIGVIKGNINKNFPNLKETDKDIKNFLDLYDFDIHKNKIFDAFPYTKLEELAYFISYKKNSSNIKEYFHAINKYWKQLKKIKDESQIEDFDNFKSYIKNLIDSDYVISHYEEFYFQKIIDKLKIKKNSGVLISFRFLRIKLNILNDISILDSNIKKLFLSKIKNQELRKTIKEEINKMENSNV